MQWNRRTWDGRWGGYLHTGRFHISISHFGDECAVLCRIDGDMNFADESYASENRGEQDTVRRGERRLRALAE